MVTSFKQAMKCFLIRGQGLSCLPCLTDVRSIVDRCEEGVKVARRIYEIP
jgi:hypothetical protein